MTEFVVLPDVPMGSGVLVSLPGWARMRVIPHESGRPWIAGHWSDGDVLSVSAGGNRLVLFGPVLADVRQLVRRLDAVRSVADLDALVSSLAGSFHLIASIRGVIRAQGSISTARQICHGQFRGVTVAADRPRILAELTGAGVDEERLALQLLAPYGPPWPLSSLSLWRGVEALRGDDYLLIRPDGTAGTVRWWVPPSPELPLEEGAAAVREALIAAIQARAATGQQLSADLSGGMDSTSLCYLAAHNGTPLITVHYAPVDPANDDKAWADQCAATLAGNQHVILPRDTAAQWFTGVSGGQESPDGPMPFFHSGMMIQHMARFVSSMGSTRHLGGLNGDELFHARLAGLHSFARRYPLRAIPYVRAKKSQRRWSLATTLRFLLSGGSYPHWLAGVAERIEDRSGDTPAGDWEIAPVMPVWATPDAVSAVQRLIREAAAENPAPASPLPAHHDIIQITRVNGAANRVHSQMAAKFGVSFEAPYLDDRVLEAVLSIRLGENLSKNKFKPVLMAAMRDIAPAEFLGRSTKGDYSAEFYNGLERHKGELLRFCDDSHLMRMGLIDGERLREVLQGVHKNLQPFMALGPTLACESWLNTSPAPTFLKGAA